MVNSTGCIGLCDGLYQNETFVKRETIAESAMVNSTGCIGLLVDILG
jgi:hypothetical protein